MLNTPFSPWPSFTVEEANAIHAVLLSNKVNYWTGSECRLFEQEFATWVGSKHAVALGNGTQALDAALYALQVGPGDEVVVTPRTFIASVSSVVLAGATPVFADVDPISGNLTADTISKVLSPRTKAVICVHLAGWPCDMDPIMALSEARGFKVIEDCAQAHGARYKGRSVGSIGHIGAWSFCQDKIMTTGGEGGMVTTDYTELWNAMWSHKDHGKSHAAVFDRQHPPGFRWVHDSFGTNWRMTEMQAAIGRIQLKRMEAWGQMRATNAKLIADALLPYTGSNGPVYVPAFGCANCSDIATVETPSCCVHANYKFYAYVRQENLAYGWTRDGVISAINEAGVPCFQGSCSEVYLEKAFDNTGWRPAQALPFAKLLGETSIMLLVHPTLTTNEINKTVEVLTQVFQLAYRKRSLNHR